MMALSLRVMADVSGKVVDPNGKPIAKAKVYVTDYKSSPPKNTIVYTDKDGKFTVKGDSLSIIAVADRYTYGSNYSRPSNEEMVITLWPENKLRGAVVDENGKPVAGAKVKCRDLNASRDDGRYFQMNMPGGDDSIGQVITGPDGAFTLLHLPSPDDFRWVSGTLTVSADGRALVNKYLQIEDLKKSLTITDPVECVLEGTLSLPGKSGPAPKGTPIMVQVFRAGSGWETRGCNVGDDGKFRLAQLPPGKVNVMLGYPAGKPGPDGRWVLSKWDWALPAKIGVELTSAQPARVDLVLTPGAIVTGKVLNKSDDKPIKGAQVVVQHPGRPAGGPSETLETNDNGEFSARVAAGSATVLVESFRDGDSYVYFQEQERPGVTVQVTDGADKSDVVVKVSPSDSSNNAYAVANRPIPDDFALTPGTYGLNWDPELDCRGSSPMRSPVDWATIKSRLKGLPRLVSKNVMGYAYPLDGPGEQGMVAVAVDESGGTGKGYDTLYVDTNRNADLSDEKPIRFSAPSGNYQVTYTDWVSVASHQGPADAEHASNPISFRLQVYRSGDSLIFYAMKRGGWRGTLDSTKGKIECVLSDSNSNGIYGDLADGASKNLKLGDYLYADTNGCGRVLLLGYGSHSIMLCNVSKVGKNFYRITSDQIGNTITVAPYDGQMGDLLVKGDNIQGAGAVTKRLIVQGANGYYDFSNLEGPARLPVGDYRIAYCDMEMKTDKGTLPFSCTFDAPVSIKPDQQTAFAVSGDLSLAIDPDTSRMAVKPGQSATLNWSIKIGDKVTLNSIGDRTAASAPKVSFYDSTGKLIKTTTAGYT